MEPLTPLLGPGGAWTSGRVDPPPSLPPTHNPPEIGRKPLNFFPARLTGAGGLLKTVGLGIGKKCPSGVTNDESKHRPRHALAHPHSALHCPSSPIAAYLSPGGSGARLATVAAHVHFQVPEPAAGSPFDLKAVLHWTSPLRFFKKKLSLMGCPDPKAPVAPPPKGERGKLAPLPIQQGGGVDVTVPFGGGGRCLRSPSADRNGRGTGRANGAGPGSPPQSPARPLGRGVPDQREDGDRPGAREEPREGPVLGPGLGGPPNPLGSRLKGGGRPFSIRLVSVSGDGTCGGVSESRGDDQLRSLGMAAAGHMGAGNG